MAIPLSQLLDLVGTLDDSPGDNTPRDRFRRFLKSSVSGVGEVRDYTETCLRQSGDQYNKALQDLINHLGILLGFQVTFGRYRGISGEIGYDGLWRSPSGLYLVIEVKTSDEPYVIKTATLVGYVDALISQKEIPDWDHALGLYVIGRADSEVRQLENAILAEKRTHQIRIVSANAILLLAEMMAEYDVGHEAVLTVLRPSGPLVDPLINLMAGLAAREKASESPADQDVPSSMGPELSPIDGNSKTPSFWLSPVASEREEEHIDIVKKLLGAGIYAFGDKTPGRRVIKPGDWICFYASGLGVVAHAKVKSSPQNAPHKLVRHKDKFPWTFQVEGVKIYSDNPVMISESVRGQLDAFKKRDPTKAWSWLVQGTRRLSKHDFEVLTR
jgi:hypothetical protein